MRKLWLTFTAMLLCSIASFAQTEIWTAQGFIDSVGTSGNYKLMADINLGDFGARTASIKSSFSGTFDGNGKTITYQASFSGSTINYALFGSVDGARSGWASSATYSTAVIKNLNVNANVSLSGNNNNMNVALLCGSLGAHGVIENCNVSGEIISTVSPTGGGGSDAGLLIGQSAGTVKYCIASGNVTGVGYAGGLIGQMTGSASVLACSFTGSVTANYPDSRLSANYEQYGNFAGGICGHASDNTNISFCTVNGSVNRSNTDDGDAEGLISSAASGNASGGGADVANCYGSGTVDGNTIDADNDLADNSGTIGVLYYKGEMDPDQIVEALNNAIPSTERDKFYFDVINGEVVLIIGQRPTTPTFVCESPIGLTVSIENGIFSANWSVGHQDASYNEQEFIISISGGEFGDDAVEELIEGTSITVEDDLEPSLNPYVFTVKSKCDDEYSNALTYTFYVNENCATINALQANNVTATSANITWQGDAEEVKLNGVAVEFTNGQTLELEDLTPGLAYIVEAIVYCTVNGENVAIPTSVNFKTHGVGYETKQTGRFNDPNTWLDNVVPEGDVATIIINTGHRVIVEHNLIITSDYKIAVNNGVLQITQQGQLINDSDENVPGIVEIVSPQKNMNRWTFIGAPFENNYKLGTIYPMSHDVSVSRYDYDSTKWDYEWAHVGTQMEAGEGYFAWPFYDGAVIFTTYGDVWNYTEGKVGEYVYGQTTTALNNADEITVTARTQNFNGGWMALANPYPAKLSVSEFADGNTNIQGQGIYRLTSNTSNGVQTYTFVQLEGNIAMTEGFFVNLASGNQVTFKKDHLTDYEEPTTQQKSQVAPREFVELSLVKGNHNSKLYFAHNQEAEQNYDIFDANKLFALGEVAEPYFVTDGIALVKEEVAELPYYATMNVRSFANDTVSFVVNNIPEGLAVSIIDGENVIDMIEGGVYTTEILTGENADRFKVLIKKSVSISDVEELEVNITNNNRHISIETTETDLQVEVYNALGQKVLSTKDRNFTLNQVSAGAYLIKAFNNKASKTQKIVVE
ncbi:MAG: T9SS type A sorting domain-containing protein [Bacteroidales bacterium]|nr:T9SS type A sorting domain-containing protein [Bacteroidales bacterium]